VLEVGVHHDDDVAVRGLDAAKDGRREPLFVGAADGAHRMGRGALFGDAPGLVRAVVVHDQHLVLAVETGG
jgi:hypothetical protein